MCRALPLLSSGQRLDALPEVERGVRVRLRPRWLRRKPCKAAVRPPNKVQRGRHHPALCPGLATDPIPSLECPSETLLCGVLGDMSGAAEHQWGPLYTGASPSSWSSTKRTSPAKSTSISKGLRSLGVETILSRRSDPRG